MNFGVAECRLNSVLANSEAGTDQRPLAGELGNLPAAVNSKCRPECICGGFGTAAYFVALPEVLKPLKALQTAARKAIGKLYCGNDHCRASVGLKRKLADHTAFIVDRKTELDKAAAYKPDRSALGIRLVTSEGESPSENVRQFFASLRHRTILPQVG